MFEKYGYSDYLIKRYISLFGKRETEKLLEANERKQERAIRINTLKTKVKPLVRRLERKGFELSKIEFCDYGYLVKKEKSSLGATTEFLLGYYYIQDPTSMIPPIELNPKKHSLILDMAAAPGGKTTHLSQLMRNAGTVLAIDVNRERMSELRDNVQRMGCENVILIRMDAKDLLKINLKFDGIILDAPCTAEGTIRKNPERKKLTREDHLKYQKIQRELIKIAYALLKRNGLLIYSTCSIAPEENEENIDWTLKYFNFEIERLKTKALSGITRAFGKKYNKNVKKCGRFYPHIHNTQGFFIAKLRKLGK